MSTFKFQNALKNHVKGLFTFLFTYTKRYLDAYSKITQVVKYILCNILSVAQDCLSF